MSGLRFKVGELAIYAAAFTADAIRHVGGVVTIYAAGPFEAGCIVTAPTGMKVRAAVPLDYFVHGPGDNDFGGARDWQLRKLDPPTEPASLTRQQSEELTA